MNMSNEFAGPPKPSGVTTTIRGNAPAVGITTGVAVTENPVARSIGVDASTSTVFKYTL